MEKVRPWEASQHLTERGRFLDLLTLMKEKESKEKTVPGLARGWPAPPSFLRGQEVSSSYVMQVSWQGP